jgi:hypothetical protein
MSGGGRRAQLAFDSITRRASELRGSSGDIVNSSRNHAIAESSADAPMLTRLRENSHAYVHWPFRSPGQACSRSRTRTHVGRTLIGHQARASPRRCIASVVDHRTQRSQGWRNRDLSIYASMGRRSTRPIGMRTRSRSHRVSQNRLEGRLRRHRSQIIGPMGHGSRRVRGGRFRVTGKSKFVLLRTSHL